MGQNLGNFNQTIGWEEATVLFCSIDSVATAVSMHERSLKLPIIDLVALQMSPRIRTTATQIDQILSRPMETLNNGPWSMVYNVRNRARRIQPMNVAAGTELKHLRNSLRHGWCGYGISDLYCKDRQARSEP